MYCIKRIFISFLALSTTILTTVTNASRYDRYNKHLHALSVAAALETNVTPDEQIDNVAVKSSIIAPTSKTALEEAEEEAMFVVETNKKGSPLKSTIKTELPADSARPETFVEQSRPRINVPPSRTIVIDPNALSPPCLSEVLGLQRSQLPPSTHVDGGAGESTLPAEKDGAEVGSGIAAEFVEEGSGIK